MRTRFLTTIALTLATVGIAGATTFTVSNTNDAGTGSLRSTIDSANADNTATTGSPHIINAAGISGTIALQSELPCIANHVTINGPGASNLTIKRDVTTTFSILTINNLKTVTIEGVRISFGYNSQAGGGIYNDGGTLTLNSCTISGNFASYGGGIYNDNGTVELTNCDLSGNTAQYIGGGIYNDGTLTVNNSTISSNASMLNHGAGIFNRGMVTMSSSTLSFNIASNLASGYGGGIYNENTLTLTNCTMSGNSAKRDGGAILNIGTLGMTNCTISGNSAVASSGGGIFIRTGTVTSLNTIIAGNTAPLDGPDIAGTVSSSGHNLIGNTTDNSGWISSDLQNVDPDLGPLQNNGGPTATMALECGSDSPAIDAGDNTDAPATDQRGKPRVVVGDCSGTPTIDIGAYELQWSQTIELATSPIELSSANHNYNPINITDFVTNVTTGDCATYDVSDVVITYVTSDEPEDASGGGDGNTLDDIAIAENCRSVQLRAERDGNGDGRVYRIHVAIADCENAGEAEFTVNVRKGSGTAVEGTTAYTETSSCPAGHKQVVQMPDAQYSLSLMESYPNPFSTSTAIGYSIGTAGPVRLTVFDINGRAVATLVDEVQSAGQYSFLFSSSDLPNGTYYYVLESNGELRTGAMNLSR